MSDPISKIDTQGMSGPTNPNYDPKKDKTEYKPMMVTPRRLHTPTMVKELKILINGISYFDVEQCKHTVEEEEPPYKDWSQ